MNKKIFAVAVCAWLVALCSHTEAQPQAKMPKIGYLGAGSGSSATNPSDLFWQELDKLGYVVGKNIVIEHRYANNRLDRLSVLAEELVRQKVDLLVAGGTNAAQAARNATQTIPIVFLNVSDPVADGLVESLARPGGNITGFTIISGVLAGKRLELLKEIVPNLARVAVLWDPKNRGSAGQWKDCQLAARDLALQLYSMEVSSADKFEGAFHEAMSAHSAALTVTQNPLLTSRRKQVLGLAAKNRLPAIYHQADFVEGGGLMSYGTDQAEPYKRAASIVQKILKGRKPADLPVEQPTKFEFMINLRTAKQIGLTIPPNVLARADRVIK